MSFRVAIGSCRCADGIKSPNSMVRDLCSRIVARLERLRSLSPDVLTALPAVTSDSEHIDARVLRLNTYRETLESGDTLVVVQGFLRSWRWPTYIGAAGVGYMYAEGILVGVDGNVRDPDEALLWMFR